MEMRGIGLCCRSTPAVLDMSGLAEIPETPRQPVTSPPPSRFVLKRPPLEGDFISVTDSSGNRVYLRQKGEADKKVILSALVLHVCGASSEQIWKFLTCFPSNSPDCELAKQNIAKLPWCTGTAGIASKSAERTGGWEGESISATLWDHKTACGYEQRVGIWLGHTEMRYSQWIITVKA